MTRIDSEPSLASVDQESTGIQARIHQAVNAVLFPNPLSNEVNTLPEITEALRLLDLWSPEKPILDVLDHTNVYSKLEQVKFKLFQNKLEEADLWIQKIEGYEKQISDYHALTEAALSQFQETRTALDGFIEQAQLKQKHISELEKRKKDTEELVKAYELSQAESNFLLSPVSSMNDDFFNALDKAVALKEKAMAELDFPNTQLSKDLVDITEMHLEAVYDRLFTWIKSQSSVFSNVQPELLENFVRVMTKFRYRPIQLSTLTDELIAQRKLALHKAFEDAMYHGEHPILKSMFDPLRSINRILVWLDKLVSSEKALWTSVLPNNMIVNTLEETLKVLKVPLEQSVESVIEEIQVDPILPYKACQLLSLYCVNVSILLPSNSAIVVSLKSLHEMAALRLKAIFEDIVLELLEEKDAPELDLLPTPSIYKITSHLKELSKLNTKTVLTQEMDLKPILDSIVDPCIQYCIIAVQSLSHTEASIFLLNCFLEIKNSILLLSDKKAAAIDNQIDIYINSLVTELALCMLKESGLFPLFTEVEEFSSGDCLRESGWTIQELETLFVHLDKFLLEGPELISFKQLLSSEQASLIKNRACSTFLKNYGLVYEAVKNPKNGSDFMELKLRTPDVIATLLFV